MNSAKIRKTLLAQIAALQDDLNDLDRLESKYGSTPDGNGGEKLLFATNQSGATIIREAIEEFQNKTFSKEELMGAILAKHPTATIKPASVASFLSRLKEAGGLKVEQQGHGKVGNRYSNPNWSPI